MERLEFAARCGPIVFDHRKGAFLPDCETLLVADLHFEKGSYLQAIGHAPLPTYDTPDTLERLCALVETFRPRHVAALGDSFHDTKAGERMSAADLAAMNALVARVPRFTWILGNHDPDIPDGLDGDQEDHIECGGFLLTHLPTAPLKNDGVNVCGHLHPKVRISTRRANVPAPCWAVSRERIIMPSFGTFTGGLDVRHPAIADELPGARAYFATTGKSVVALAG
ncbi:ligase-associated DNA damage response endonuclease PdeM [uncultured Algimonas sp.]|uniref:ligase-associated DNA damage response endonuclease PdeM n=1 Tax=uncultured Algimonas sp. TaxID=1547920 RepID=UPI0026298902|nr:ligase-associated DNA damage response endonuclease PdeM [uncultured Algimonas sp.]